MTTQPYHPSLPVSSAVVVGCFNSGGGGVAYSAKAAYEAAKAARGHKPSIADLAEYIAVIRFEEARAMLAARPVAPEKKSN